jgi:hypothetical protein
MSPSLRTRALAANVIAVPPTRRVLRVFRVARVVAMFGGKRFAALAPIGVTVAKRRRETREVHLWRRRLGCGTGAQQGCGGDQRTQRLAEPALHRDLNHSRKKCPTREAIGHKESARCARILDGGRLCWFAMLRLRWCLIDGAGLPRSIGFSSTSARTFFCVLLPLFRVGKRSAWLPRRGRPPQPPRLVGCWSEAAAQRSAR